MAKTKKKQQDNPLLGLLVIGGVGGGLWLLSRLQNGGNGGGTAALSMVSTPSIAARPPRAGIASHDLTKTVGDEIFASWQCLNSSSTTGRVRLGMAVENQQVVGSAVNVPGNGSATPVVTLGSLNVADGVHSSVLLAEEVDISSGAIVAIVDRHDFFVTVSGGAAQLSMSGTPSIARRWR